MAVETGPTRYYVKNAITLGQYKYTIKVIGYDETKGRTAPYVIGKGHVIEVPLTGAEAPVEKWLLNKCIEVYSSKKHPHAILTPLEYAAPAPEPDDDEEDEEEEPSEQAKPISDIEDEFPDKKPARRKPHNQASVIGMRDPRGV